MNANSLANLVRGIIMTTRFNADPPDVLSSETLCPNGILSPMDEHACEKMSAYLLHAAQNKLSPGQGTLVLPSISQLAVQFCCPHLAVYDVLRDFRNQGYDYRFSGINGSLLLWQIRTPQGI
jgi:hypothetical protein